MKTLKAITLGIATALAVSFAGGAIAATPGQGQRTELRQHHGVRAGHGVHLAKFSHRHARHHRHGHRHHGRRHV